MIHILIASASIYKLFIHQTDVKIVFLNGDLEEEIYMVQLEGCIMLGNENKVWKLKKIYIVLNKLLNSGIRNLITL